MPPLHKNRSITRYFAALPLAALLCAFPQSQATDLADFPLVNGAEIQVLPNIMLNFDNSSSMQRYAPKDGAVNGQRNNAGTSLTSCGDYAEALGDYAAGYDSQHRRPCWRLSGTNGLAYNPAVTYTPPVDANGVTLGSKGGNRGWKAENDTTFDKVPHNGYGIGGNAGSATNATTDTRDLARHYPNRKYCIGAGNVNNPNCKDANEGETGYNYMYPNSTYSTTWDYPGGSNTAAINTTTTPLGGPEYYTADVEWCTGFTGSGTTAIRPAGDCGKTMSTTRKTPIYSNMKVTRVVPDRNSYPKAPTRTDCKGSDCTYLEEMRNFANWFAWYRMRGNVLKSAVTLAFKDVQGRSVPDDPDDLNCLHARVGFMTIHNNDTTEAAVGNHTAYLQIRDFEGSQRTKFYDHVIGTAINDGGTPLRRSLAWIGRLYAGRHTINGTHLDPVQYSCQRNYSITFTDGAWNDEQGNNLPGNIIYGNPRTDGHSGNPDYGVRCSTANTATATSDPPACLKISGTSTATTNLMTPRCNEDTSKVVECNATGALGGCPPATRPECDVYTRSLRDDDGSSLADVAYYYYHTDLRKDKSDFEIKNVLPTGSDPALDDVAPWQHMTTFTVGLGMDGYLEYRPDYKTATSGDFWEIRQGTKNWSRPPSAGGYFEDIHSLPKADDLWHAAVNGRGQYFSAQTPQDVVSAMEETFLTISKAEGSAAAAALSTLQPVEGDNLVYVASYQTVDWNGNMEAYAIDPESGEINDMPVWRAQGQLNNKITGDCGNNSQNRTIYFAKSGSSSITLEPFRWENLNSTQKTWFDTSRLSQFQSGKIDQRCSKPSTDLSSELSRATGETLVNYLRGENMYENRSRAPDFQAACPNYGAFYRTRQNVLGDIIHAGPVFVGKPAYDYKDDGYGAFKDSNEGREKMVYAGANDGMLHAFDATNGTEQWAFIPPQVMPNLFKLADQSYSKNHQYYVDGPIVTGDINDGAWKTILVGALGKGGRGIYALDITSPGSPKLLWTFSATLHDTDTEYDNDLGYTYGMPQITKLKNGTWVVVIASGYNNTSPGDGKGYVFVLDAATGKKLKKIGTGVSDSGLAALNGFVPDLAANNTALRIYGGDLLGNLWGFDVNKDVSYKIISLGTAKPITVLPLVSNVDKASSSIALFFGTGRYLGQSDLRGTQTGTIYAIRDKTVTAKGEDTGASGSVSTSELRSASSSSSVINWAKEAGWYYNLPTGQLVHVAAQKYGPVLIVTATRPTSEKSCSIGGEGYLYMFNAITSGFAPEQPSYLTNTFSSPLFGLTTFQTRDKDGKKHGHVLGIGAGAGKVVVDIPEDNTSFSQGRSPGTRMIWHELNSN
ncbi:MAG: hypothetical protein LBP94_04670 [Zoogloeaceae bacterium]|jgi:type IV pilus assembly protein PilY1|nr:hypothetical protein [Zoogloeaceae bacterium]